MTPLPWSHSALSDFLTCAKAYYHKRIAKDVADPPNEAGAWGDYAHKEFEKYLNACIASPTYAVLLHSDGTRTIPADAILPLPADLEHYRSYLDEIVKCPGTMSVECRYAINRKFEPCDFFAEDVFCRCIIDVLHIDGQRARVIDHKTGNRKEDTRQLKLCALMVFIHHPEVLLVKAGYTWLKDKSSKWVTYVRAKEEELWAEFIDDLTQYRRAFHTMTFPPRPSGLCKGWCPVHTCQFWSPKRA